LSTRPSAPHFDTAPVRSGEELNLPILTDYLLRELKISPPLTLEQFPSGHSNLTYLLRAGSREYVLRRGPLGPVAPKAHDMAREYRLLRMLHPHFPEAPQPLHLCEDPAVLGSVFFLMERRHGVILRDNVPPDFAQIPNYPQRLSEAMISCLVRLHAIDVAATGLIALGKPDGFLARQVQGWAERWHRAQVEEVPQMDAVIHWLEQRLPQSPPPTLVHNDYKLDNVMFRFGSADHIEAVLDWEMATIGDPLADVGLALCYWAWASAPQLRAQAIPTLSSQPGWYRRDQFVELYARLSGRDLANIGFYEVLGVFKLAVILQQIYFRFYRGQTADHRFRNFGERVRGLITLAVSLLERQP
jgi:aminoglycoside phosphotransferase (APT) family kinase protein